MNEETRDLCKDVKLPLWSLLDVESSQDWPNDILKHQRGSLALFPTLPRGLESLPLHTSVSPPLKLSCQFVLQF